MQFKRNKSKSDKNKDNTYGETRVMRLYTKNTVNILLSYRINKIIRTEDINVLNVKRSPNQVVLHVEIGLMPNKGPYPPTICTGKTNAIVASIIDALED